MIISIEKRDQEEHAHLLCQMFKARKRVFFDQLGWDIGVHGDMERDAYDDLDPVYLVLTDNTKGHHFASLRLLPTTGPTLLHDVFHDTMPETANLAAPQIWECTRFCVDEEADTTLSLQHNISASSLLLLGLCELGLKSGMEMIVANFDPAMKRIYHKAGCEVTVHSTSHSHGRRPVACGTFEVSPRILKKMRTKLGIVQNLYGNRFFSRRKPDKRAA